MAGQLRLNSEPLGFIRTSCSLLILNHLPGKSDRYVYNITLNTCGYIVHIGVLGI